LGVVVAHGDREHGSSSPRTGVGGAGADLIVLPGAAAGRTAEAEGFEPPDGCPSLAFKASAFGRSATLPRIRVAACGPPSRGGRGRRLTRSGERRATWARACGGIRAGGHHA